MKRAVVAVVCVAVLGAAVAAVAMEAKRVVACTGVENREPVGAAETFPAGVGEVTCFSEVTGAGEAATVTHVWYHGDEERARVDLHVRGERWRTWSSKRVMPSETGPWHVVVLGPDGAELGRVAFTVGE